MAHSREEIQRLLVSLYGSCYPKLTLYMDINQLLSYVLIAIENMRLGELYLKTKTEKLGRFLLEVAAINWIMKCDG